MPDIIIYILAIVFIFVGIYFQAEMDSVLGTILSWALSVVLLAWGIYAYNNIPRKELGVAKVFLVEDASCIKWGKEIYNMTATFGKAIPAGAEITVSQELTGFNYGVFTLLHNYEYWFTYNGESQRLPFESRVN
jgi:hypothetical protein